MGNVTSITYERVRSNANTIRECSRKMQNTFQSFETSMRRIRSEDVFAGSASESLNSRFNSLKSKFDLYIQQVNEFSNMMLHAADATERTEKDLTTRAEQLK